MLGHSFGGHVALEYALRYPDNLSHLVLLDTGGDAHWSLQNAAEVLAQRGFSPDTVALARRWFNGQVEPRWFLPTLLRLGRAYNPYQTLPQLAHGMLQGEWRATLRPEALIFAAHDLLPGWTVMDRLGGIAVPTLVMAGRDDFIFPLEHQAELAASIPGACLRIIERAGHDPQSERPDEIMEAMREFLLVAPSVAAASSSHKVRRPHHGSAMPTLDRVGPAEGRMAARTLLVAAIQTPASPDVAAGIERAGPLVRQAAADGSELALLPELMAVRYVFSDEMWDSAEPSHGPTVAWLKDTARDARIWLGTSFLEASGEDFYNERWHRIQMDMAPLYARSLGVPAVFVNKVGPYDSPAPLSWLPAARGMVLPGHATIADFDGTVAGQLDGNEGVLTATVTLDPARKVRTVPRTYGRCTYPSGLGGLLTLPPAWVFGRVYALNPERPRRARRVAAQEPTVAPGSSDRVRHSAEALIGLLNQRRR